MKKTVLFLCLSVYFSVGSAQVKDPVIMNIGGKDVTKSEFEYIWNKNNTNNTADKKSLDEYVDLFVNFKLKVAEAKAQGIDTTRSFVRELTGYRHQLVTPYLTDKTAEDALYKEAYDRIRQYIEVSHILLKVKADATPQDTLVLYKKAMDIYNRAAKGEDFTVLAKATSEDDATKNEGGYLGTTTGLNYVYTFENAAFNTPVGKVSKPVRTIYGYHIVKVISRRPAGGLYSSAHIMKMVAPYDTPEAKAAKKDSIFKYYEAIKKGEDFTLYATKHSDDQNASQHNGEYGLMYCGSFPFEYENAVYKLKPGEMSEPFQSKYGWHIVKALDFQPYPDMEKMHDVLAKKIARTDRAQVLKEALVEKLKKEYGYTSETKNLEAFVKAYEAIKISKDSSMLKSLTESDAPLFTLGEKAYTQKQFAAMLGRRPQNINVKVAYDAFVQQNVLSFEDTQLERKYPEFRHLMQEYSDGILLFEVSNREVWEKASSDTTGLKTFYATNKSKYTWDKPHYRGFIIQCANADIAKKAQKLMKKLPQDSIAVTLKRTFNTDSTTLVKVERGLYAQGENANIDFLAFKQGKLQPKSDLPEIFIRGKVVKAPESYQDVRGLVISDYQNDLEQKWIESLKGKYKVIVYKDVVNTVNKN